MGFLLVLVPAYWHHYGPSNFLWFSNVALALTCAGIVLESPLLVSAAAVGVLIPEIGWSADLLVSLVIGREAWGLTDYLWDPAYPGWVRALSLYHLLLSPGLWWLLGRLGYDWRGLLAWAALGEVVLVISFFATDPALNINRVRGLGGPPPWGMSDGQHLVYWMLLLPTVVWWPTHCLLRWGRPDVGSGVEADAPGDGKSGLLPRLGNRTSGTDEAGGVGPVE